MPLVYRSIPLLLGWPRASVNSEGQLTFLPQLLTPITFVLCLYMYLCALFFFNDFFAPLSPIFPLVLILVLRERKPC